MKILGRNRVKTGKELKTDFEHHIEQYSKYASES